MPCSTVILSPSCTLELICGDLKILMPKPHPRSMKSESLGWNQDIINFLNSPDDSKAQPNMRTTSRECN